jgi:hypothetical protein
MFSGRRYGYGIRRVHKVVINLIADTSTKQSLRIRAELDKSAYPFRTKISDEELASVRIRRRKFHGDWNYSIHPPKRNSGKLF